jgi:hypothetical protein
MPVEGTSDVDIDEDDIDEDGIDGREVLVPMRQRRIVATEVPERDGTCTFFK